MGAGALTCSPKRRYLNGMFVAEYWDEVAWPENREMLETLSLDHDKARLVFDAFVAVDDDNSGEMSLVEFHAWLGVPQTKFSERVFGVLDIDGSGALDFEEFAVGVWNYCTYDTKLITKLAFDIFDVDRIGKLETCECDALLRMVYDVDHISEIEGPPSGIELLEEIDVNGDGDVTLEEFSELMETHMYILAPAFDLQRALRQRILGVKFWEGETRVRQALFADFDSAENDSMEAITEILEQSKKKRGAFEAEEERRRLAARSDEEKRLEEREEALALEREDRSKRLEEQAVTEQTPEEWAEQEAGVGLAAAVRAMDATYSFNQLPQRLEARHTLFEAMAWASECASYARVARRVKDLEQASVGDAEAMTEEFLKTERGQKRLKYEQQMKFGSEMHAAWSQSASGIQQVVAPMFKSVDGRSVSVAAALSLALAPNALAASSREHAYHLLLDEQRHELRGKAERHVDRMAKRSELEYAKARDDLVGTYGGEHTKWEKLVDNESGGVYWYHTGSGAQVWDAQPCVCHQCDELVDGFDVRCFSCQTDRSAYNRSFYDGPSTLSPLVEETVPDSDDESDDGDDHDGSDDDDGGGDGGGSEIGADERSENADGDDEGDDDVTYIKG